jgi:hypothetical protein
MKGVAQLVKGKKNKIRQLILPAAICTAELCWTEMNESKRHFHRHCAKLQNRGLASLLGRAALAFPTRVELSAYG